MKKLGSTLIVACLLLVLFTGSVLAAKPQPVLIDGFNNSNNWMPTTSEGLNTVVSTPQFVDDRLVITLPQGACSPYSQYCPFSSGVESVFQLQGDYDVQVDYELLPDASGVIPQHTGVYAGLCVPQGNVARASLGDEEYFSQFNPQTYGWVVTSDTKGTLRMTRSTKNGQPVTQGWFLLPGGKWHPMLSGGGDNSNINIALSVWSYSWPCLPQNVSVAFDNFIVNSGTLLPSTTTPTDAFMSGKGWINSPAGANIYNPSLYGKADFDFSARFERGTSIPKGQFRFDLSMANLAFSSTSLEGIQINGSEFVINGTGTINSQGAYNFILTAFDGQNNGLDTFRLRISDINTGAAVYDNATSILLGNGNIEIHKN